MSVVTEPLHAGCYIMHETPPGIDLCREVVTIVSGAGLLVPGQVLGKITATGKYKAYNNANSDGSQVAAAILFDHVDATSADKTAVVTARLTVVNKNELTFAATTGNNIADALVDFLTNFIIARS